MGKILTVIITVIVCAAVAAAAYFLVIQKNNASLIQNISPNILYLTNPVTSFSGIIDSVSGNTITISQEMILSQPLDLNAALQTKKITYQALVNEKTIVSQTAANVPYNFKSNSLASPSAQTSQLSVRDIKAGQFVIISSSIDLRTLSGNQFDAIAITISPNINTISGKITNITGNTITVTGISISNSGLPTIPGASAAQEKQFTITVDQNTEISGNTTAQPQKLTISDLKKDTQVTIYAEGTTALRIAPVPSNLSVTIPQTTQSGTQQPK